MIAAYVVGAVVMAWHLWTRRARHVRRGPKWLAGWRHVDNIFAVAFWPLHIIASLLDI